MTLLVLSLFYLIGDGDGDRDGDRDGDVDGAGDRGLRVEVGDSVR